MRELGVARRERVGSWPCIKDGILGLIVREGAPLRAVALWSDLLPRLQSMELSISEVNDAISTLLREGMVSVASARSDAEGGAAYDATPRGVERSRAWLRTALHPPYLREELLLRIAVACGVEDIQALIEVVAYEEGACMARALQLGRVSDEIVMRALNDLPLDDWRTRNKRLVQAAEIESCEADMRWLQKVHAELKEELEDTAE